MSEKSRGRNRFYGQLWRHRTWYARGWALLGLGIWAALFWGIGKDYLSWSELSKISRISTWRTEDYLTMTALVVLIASAPFMHLLDRHGRGFKERHRASDALIPLDDGTVSGLLSVQSIRTAVTTFILTALVALVPKTEGIANWNAVSPFKLTLGLIVGFSLLVSLVTTLVATLCLDYSIRFSWNADDPKETKENAENTKFSLRAKARALNEIGFYSLMWAVAALPAFYSSFACLLSSLLVYLVTWSYYFFPGNEQVRKPAGPSEALTQAVKDLGSKPAKTVEIDELSRAASDLNSRQISIDLAGASDRTNPDIPKPDRPAR